MVFPQFLSLPLDSNVAFFFFFFFYIIDLHCKVVEFDHPVDRFDKLEVAF